MSRFPVVPTHTTSRQPRRARRSGPAYLRGLPASVWRRALTAKP
ncbi:MAG TPA: hypothetical protein VFZ77_10360 [Acidimicrobiales bacterium]